MATFRGTQRQKLEAMVGKSLTARNYEYCYDKASRLAGTPNAQTAAPPTDQHAPQAAGDRNNLQGPGYDNDASGWVRGAGESAEDKPGFDASTARQPQPRSPAQASRRR